jgi:hypothetical protein
MPELYLFVASVFCVALLIYMMQGGVNLGTAGGWVVLTCVHGLLVKPLFVYFNIPNAQVLDGLLFRSISRDEYWRWGLTSLVAYGLFFAALVIAGRYKHVSGRVSSESRIRYSNWRLLVFLSFAIVGVIGFFLKFPDLLGSVSKNRLATTDLADYDGGGVWRYLTDFSYIVSVCAIVNAGDKCRRRSSLALFVVGALIWFPFCYLSDQRGLMLFSVVTYLIAYNRCVKRLSAGRVAVAILAVCALVLVKTITRLQLGGAELQDTVAQTLANLVGQNLIEHSKMVAIIKAIPDQINFQAGFTYLNSILVLIPRSLFPDKPFVNLDTTIGQSVFGCDALGACAVPPGLLGESYLNFGIAGLVLVPILSGTLIGKLDLRFRIAKAGSTFEIFYLVSGLYLGMAILGSGISSSITEVVTQGILVALVCFVCRKSNPSIPPIPLHGSGGPRAVQTVLAT